MTPIEGCTAVVTGGASGIGAAMATMLASEGAAHVVVVDLDAERAAAVADSLGGRGVARACDVSSGDDCEALIAWVEDTIGPIDLLCSNAGIASGGGVDSPDEMWDRLWAVNVMGTVHLARAWLPSVRARRRGHLLVTASAAGLLTNLGDGPYSATKHAAVGLAEWLSITHAADGLTVQCLCPQGVRTPMVTGGLEQGALGAAVVEAMGLIEPEAVADAVRAGLATDSFLILPHAEVADYVRAKAADPDRWLGGMRKLQRRLTGG